MNYCLQGRKFVEVMSKSQVDAKVKEFGGELEVGTVWGQLIMDGADVEEVTDAAIAVNHTGNADGKARTTKHTKNCIQHTQKVTKKKKGKKNRKH